MSFVDNIIEQVYPRAKWPTRPQIMGIGMWGGVAAAGIFFAVQGPAIELVKSVLPGHKEEEKH